MFAFLRTLCARRRRNANCPVRGCQPRLEALEERLALSNTPPIDWSIAIGGRLYNTASYAQVGFRNTSLVGFLGSYNPITNQHDNNPSDYTAYINWGDGQTSVVKGSALVMGPDGPQCIALDKNLQGVPSSPDGYVLDVKASHVYQNPTTSQPYTVLVQIQGPNGMSAQAAAGTVFVTPLPNPKSLPPTQPTMEPAKKSPSYVTFGVGGTAPWSAQTGTLITNQWLGNLNGFYGGGTYGGGNNSLDPAAGDYHVQLNWGDSTLWSDGQVVPNTQGNGYTLELDGTHEYFTPGTYNIVAYITGPDGTTWAQKLSTVFVTGKALQPAINTPTEGTIVSSTGPGEGLYIGNGLATAADYKALVEPNGTVNPLRLQIYNAMNQNPTGSFHFANLLAAQQNFQQRVDIVQFMDVISRDDPKSPNRYPLTLSQDGSEYTLHFSYTNGVNQTANPAYWKAGPRDDNEFQYQGSDAYDAVMSLIRAPYIGECGGAADIAILYATAQTLGKDPFNELFPGGLTLGPDLPGIHTSTGALLQSIDLSGPHGNNPPSLSTAAMVPGDLVYMSNLPGYQGGPWSGENAIYMGNYDLISKGEPDWQAGATPRFSGLGLYDQSSTQLQNDLWSGYQQGMHPTPGSVSPNGIGWAYISRPTTPAP
jgi:Protein-glutamine gamma-glutamyltransferase